MNITMNSISKLALLLFISVSISACGGIKKAASTDNVANTEDITRPPVVEKDTTPVETAVADGETVSFDEWRKRRQAELEAQDRGE